GPGADSSAALPAGISSASLCAVWRWRVSLPVRRAYQRAMGPSICMPRYGLRRGAAEGLTLLSWAPLGGVKTVYYRWTPVACQTRIGYKAPPPPPLPPPPPP